LNRWLQLCESDPDSITKVQIGGVMIPSSSWISVTGVGFGTPAQVCATKGRFVQQGFLQQEGAEVGHRATFLLRSLEQGLVHPEADSDRDALRLALHHPELIIQSTTPVNRF
jgi:hypothetical protein